MYGQWLWWSLRIPEVCGSNPVIGKIYIEIRLLSTTYIEKTKIKKKRLEMVHLQNLRCVRCHYILVRQLHLALIQCDQKNCQMSIKVAQK